MNCRDFPYVTSIWIILFIAGVTGVITNGPSNAVAEVGGQATFSCTSSTTLQNWIFTRSRDDLGTSSGQDIAVNCAIQPVLETHYEVDRPIGSTSTCNLIVKATTMQQAGIYTCSDTAPGPSAILTVIDPVPVITSNNTIAAVEGESVIFECVLNYNGTTEPTPTLRPYFYWTNSTGQNVTSYSDSTTENMAVSRLAVTAGRQNITPYTCHVYFQLNPSNTPKYAANTPTLNSSATSSTIEVRYYPAITSVTSTVSTSDNCVYKQETLTCTADAHPQAEYEWLDLSNDVVTSGSDKSISIGGRYQCIAFNIIRSQRYNDTKIESLSTCYSPYNLTIGGSSCNSTSCSCSENQSSVAVSCVAFGYPEPIYQWWSDVPGLENLGGNQSMQVAIDGNYSCTASNVYGSQTHSNTVSVLISNCLPHPTTAPSTLTTLQSTSETSISQPMTTPSTTLQSTPKTSNDPAHVSLTSTVSSSMTMALLASLLQYILN